MNLIGFKLLALSVVFQNAFSKLCASSGFNGCACNILGACDNVGNPVTGLNNRMTGYAPTGIEQFHYQKVRQQNLAYLCEGQTTTIMYDCNARIPLYSATMMTGAQLHARYQRVGTFRASGDPQLNRYFQQNNADYVNSSQREICYESRKRKYLTDNEWYRQKNSGKVGDGQCRDNAQQTVLTRMAKGHLIAAQFGRGNPARVAATFTYTNAVPQFASFNSGQWRRSENHLVWWGQNNCAVGNNIDVRMFIVVGAIPSTYTRTPRFFGSSGFSDFQGWSRLRSTYLPNSGGGEYKVNVPSYMWTAACCTFRYQNAQGNWQDGTQSIAYYRSNDPGTGNCITTTPRTIFSELRALLNIRSMSVNTINVFPQNANC